MEIIIYGSKYGTAKQYALELSKRTGIKAEEYSNIKDINRYDTIIYVGALYAGNVLGMKKTLVKIKGNSNQKIIIATVGLAAPDDEENRNAIRQKIKKQLPYDIYSHSNIHFLRGAIDYSTLNLKHRTMMAFVYRKAKNLKEEEKTSEVKAVLETYGKTVSYVDFDALNDIIKEIY